MIERRQRIRVTVEVATNAEQWFDLPDYWEAMSEKRRGEYLWQLEIDAMNEFTTTTATIEEAPEGEQP